MLFIIKEIKVNKNYTRQNVNRLRYKEKLRNKKNEIIFVFLHK